jgi:single-strand DNA-binding protein
MAESSALASGPYLHVGAQHHTKQLAIRRGDDRGAQLTAAEPLGQLGQRTVGPNLRVAVTQRVQQDGEWRDGDTSILRVNVWRGQAEHLADSLAKGDRVMVTGRLRQRSWETPEGEKRSVTELEADEVGASLRWATAKVERSSQRGNGQRDQGRERQAERGGDFDNAPPF